LVTCGCGKLLVDLNHSRVLETDVCSDSFFQPKVNDCFYSVGGTWYVKKPCSTGSWETRNCQLSNPDLRQLYEW
jgi:hypothetical protein